MLINTIEELRLAFPTSAIDDITPLSGFLQNSEFDFLQPKLGPDLYKQLCKERKDDFAVDAYIELVQANGLEQGNYPWPFLLFHCQRAVAYDAFSRAIGVQAVSLSNMGVNVATADEYGTPSKEAINDFKQTCIKEAHISINIVLTTLEQFAKEKTSLATKEESTLEDAEKAIVEIATLWEKSDFYYQQSGLLINTAERLQQYLNIYNNREKFIQLLPDLHFVQDELIAPHIGSDFIERVLVNNAYDTDLKQGEQTVSVHLARLKERLRRCEAAYLKERTDVINFTDKQRQRAHDEAERHLKTAIDYCRIHQADLESYEGVKSAPWYVAADEQPKEPTFDNGNPDNAFLVFPGLD